MAEPAITRHVLCDGDVSVAILNLGCITQDWRVPLGRERVPVVLGHADPQDYRTHPGTLGVIAGRLANRTAGARFTWDGREYQLPANDGRHHLHGGPEGLSRRIWAVETDGQRAIQLSRVSPEGEAGYPGTLGLSVRITLSGFTLRYEMIARADRPVPVNLAQHNYYNLMGRGDIAEHRLQIAASACTPTDAELIPSGEIAPVAGTDLDFRQMRAIGRQAIDINMVLDDPGAGPGMGFRSRPAARLRAPNGLELVLETDQPGLQLYTGAGLRPRGRPHPGQSHDAFGGLCLEPQHFPNAVNTPGFAVPVAAPEAPYRQVTTVTIAPAP